MRQILFPMKSVLLMSLLTIFVACSDDDAAPMPQPEPTPMPEVAPLVEFTALSNDNRVIYFNARNLSSPIRNLAITGLQSGENIISIDYRPATGQLYGLGSTSRLYVINETSGLATPLGTTSLGRWWSCARSIAIPFRWRCAACKARSIPNGVPSWRVRWWRCCRCW